MGEKGEWSHSGRDLACKKLEFFLPFHLTKLLSQVPLFCLSFHVAPLKNWTTASPLELAAVVMWNVCPSLFFLCLRHKHKYKHKKNELVRFLVLMLTLRSTQFSLAYTCAFAYAYALLKTRLKCRESYTWRFAQVIMA